LTERGKDLYTERGCQPRKRLPGEPQTDYASGGGRGQNEVRKSLSSKGGKTRKGALL